MSADALFVHDNCYNLTVTSACVVLQLNVQL